MLTEGMYIADRYEIVGKIGAGGMSDVYKAKDHILGRFVAIKVLKQEFSEDLNFVTKFRTEAQSAASLEHPNIVNIYDVGSEDGMYYIVMEYVEGITLKTYVEKKGHLTFKESVSIAIQVARGIESAHNKNIIHRDIKPQNIIISTEGKVKVTDFGIARAASANTISSDVMGSVHYASPEQARNGFVDTRSDIYSLGIVMYEMVTGRVPFDGETTVAVAIQHLQEEMPQPSAYAEKLPISMEKIILKCAQKNPDRRYQTIEDLLNDLRKSLINPDEDFVIIAPLLDNGKTKVISEEELKLIKEGRAGLSNDDLEDQEIHQEDDEDEDEDAFDEDDENVGGFSPKMDKAITIMSIVVAAIIVIVVIILIASFAGLLRFGKKPEQSTPPTTIATESEIVQPEPETEEMISMINITGMSLDDAEEALAELGLELFVVGTEKSDKPRDTILSQSVEEGEEIAVGDTVDVVISGAASTSEEMVTVPNVIGYSEAEAIQGLNNSSLRFERKYEYSNDVENGKVISTEPGVGSSVKKNSTVTIVVSQGVQSVNVPNVVGKDLETAENELIAAGLTVATEETYSDTVEEGKVISQSVVDGKAVPAGTEITIKISLGKEVIEYKAKATVTIPAGYTVAEYKLKDDSGTIYDSGSTTVSGTTWNYTSSVLTNNKATKLEVTWSIEDGSLESYTESYAVNY